MNAFLEFLALFLIVGLAIAAGVIAWDRMEKRKHQREDAEMKKEMSKR